jgi:hypothetical protein
MHAIFALAIAVGLIVYLLGQILLHSTQNKREPQLLESCIPFFDGLLGIIRHRANYLAFLRSVQHDERLNHR